jgi:hypothetical protein
MWWDGTAGTTRLRWPEGSLASWPGGGSILRMSLPKDSGWRRTRQSDKRPDPDLADTLTACLKRALVSVKPGFCGTDWDWRLLILIGSRANHDGEITPRDRKGNGCAAPLDGISTNAQNQPRNAAVPPCSRSPGLAQAASTNPQYRDSCHKPRGYRRLPGGSSVGTL